MTSVITGADREEDFMMYDTNDYGGFSLVSLVTWGDPEILTPTSCCLLDLKPAEKHVSVGNLRLW